MRRLLLLLVLLLGLAAGSSLLGYGPVVITKEGQQKIALFLGEPRAVITEPGVSFAFPITETRTFDRRLLHLTSEPKEIQTLDRERILVDNYVIWRIEDPLLFNASFPTGVSEAETQIDQQVRSLVREVIGQRTLPDVLYGARTEIMTDITEKSHAPLQRFGIAVRDVRISRTELPERTEENVYARMRAERDRLARKHRAEGEEEARRLRAEADRDARVVVAEARRDAEIERGLGDAEAAAIYATAYDADREFYDFVRSLEAYRETLGEGTTLVVPPSHSFFRIMGDPDAPDGAGPP